MAGDTDAPRRGLSEAVIREISALKQEPDWMLDFRLRSYETFTGQPMPDWGGETPEIVFDDIHYIQPAERHVEDLKAQGAKFMDLDTAVKEEPEVVQKYFGSIVGAGDNKFSALNSAVWSGGSFVYVPPGVEVEMPLQRYPDDNTRNMGRFERTLVIADEGATVHYIEGCSAPVYSSEALHAPVVELVAMAGARITYMTTQNWSNNVLNLVNKGAAAFDQAHVEWIVLNIGSGLTRGYPAVYLMGPKASGDVLSVAYAGEGQHQDVGATMVHAAAETTSKIVAKSVAKDGGRTTYRGLLRVEDGAQGCRSQVQCDALLLDGMSGSDTYPDHQIGSLDAQIDHAATVTKVAAEHLFYLMSRGLSQEQAMGMVVNGFIEPVTRTLPVEYSVEWSRLLELQMEGSVG